MTIREDLERLTNFPSVLQRKNIPLTLIRQRGVGRQAMALVRGETPVRLAQKVLRGQPVRRVLNRFRGQIRPPYQRFGPIEKNIPGPYPRPMFWPPGRNIANLPSVVADIRNGSGPERTVRPQVHVEW